MSIPKIVKNIRSDSAPPFLQIPYSDWIAAGKTLTKSAFILYLYIAQNANESDNKFNSLLTGFGVKITK